MTISKVTVSDTFTFWKWFWIKLPPTLFDSTQLHTHFKAITIDLIQSTAKCNIYNIYKNTLCP